MTVSARYKLCHTIILRCHRTRELERKWNNDWKGSRWQRLEILGFDERLLKIKEELTNGEAD